MFLLLLAASQTHSHHMLVIVCFIGSDTVYKLIFYLLMVRLRICRKILDKFWLERRTVTVDLFAG